MDFFLIDVHDDNEEQRCSYAEFDWIDSNFPINFVLVLLDKVPYLRQWAFLDANVGDEQDLVDVYVVNVTDQFLARQLVGQQAEKKEEQCVSVGR